MAQQTMADFQEPEEGGQNYNQIRRFIDDLKEREITHHNFRNALPDIKSNIQLIESQIESHHLQVRKAYKKQKDVVEKYGEDKLRRLEEDDQLVPAALYDASYEAQRNLREMYAWQTINTEMQYIVNKKLVRALLNVADYEVESKVVERVSNLHSQMMNQTKDMVTNLVQQQNQKIDLIKENMNERGEMLMQKNLAEMREIQRLQNEGMRGLVEYVGELYAKNSGGLSADELEKMLEKKFKNIEKTLREQYDDRVQDAVVPRKERFQPETPGPVHGSAERFGDLEEDDDEAPAGEYDEPSNDFQCPYCDEEFSDDVMLDTHVETAHGDDEEF